MCIIVIILLVVSLLLFSLVILSVLSPQKGRNVINGLLSYYGTPHKANDEASNIVYVENLFSAGWFVLQAVVLLASLLIFLGVIGYLIGKSKFPIFIILAVLVMSLLAAFLLLLTSIYKNTFDTYILMPLFRRTYESPQTIETALWNIIMMRGHCCGINNATDFAKSAWFSSKRSAEFPPSCCKFNITTTRDRTVYSYKQSECYSSPGHRSNYNTGCRSEVKGGLHLVLFYILLVAPIIILLILLILLCKKTRNSRKKKKNLKDNHSCGDKNTKTKCKKNNFVSEVEQENYTPTTAKKGNFTSKEKNLSSENKKNSKQTTTNVTCKTIAMAETQSSNKGKTLTFADDEMHFDSDEDSHTSTSYTSNTSKENLKTVSMMTIDSKHKDNVMVKIRNCSELQKTKPKVDIRKGMVGCREFVTVHIRDQD